MPWKLIQLPSAYGVVYKAKDRRNGRAVAVKKMQISAENSDLIRKEIMTLREIKCANCVEYLGSYYKDGNLFVRFRLPCTTIV